MKLVVASLAFLASLLAGATTVWADGCSASSIFGSDCVANCSGAGIHATCSGGIFSSKCECKGGPGISTPEVKGTGTSGMMLAIEVYNKSCASPPCMGAFIGSATVTTFPGQDATSLARDISDALDAAALPGCVVNPLCTTVGCDNAFQVSCTDFMPKFRICAADGNNCPDIFEPKSGTDPDIIVDLAGFRFQTREAKESIVVVPTMGTVGLVTLGALLSLSAVVLLQCKRRHLG